MIDIWMKVVPISESNVWYVLVGEKDKWQGRKVEK
jgi:hypothetical protein